MTARRGRAGREERAERAAAGERLGRGAKAERAAAGGGWLYGLHAARAALANPERVCRRLVGTPEGLAALGPVTGPQAESVGRPELERLLPPGAVHQGVAVQAEPLPELGLEDLLFDLPADALFVALDQVTDPQNVGAILRSAAAFGARALILPDRNAPAAASGALAKAASGALELVPVVRVVNLARALRQLKEAEVWCVALAGEADLTLDRALRPGPLALVMGAEGEGVRRLTAETCDAVGRLATNPDFPTLNVSAAAAVALHVARSAPR